MATTIGLHAVWISAACECFSASVEITVVRSDAQDSGDDDVGKGDHPFQCNAGKSRGPRWAMLMECETHNLSPLFLGNCGEQSLVSPIEHTVVRAVFWVRGGIKPLSLPLWNT
jgi:hypothetical protein